MIIGFRLDLQSHLLSAFLIFTFTLGWATSSPGKDNNQILLCQQNLYQGEAALCVLSPLESVDEVQIFWLDKLIEPPLQKTKGKWAVHFLLPAGLTQEPGTYPLIITLRHNRGTRVIKRQVEIMAKTYPSQRLSLPAHMVTLDEETSRRVKVEIAETKRLLSNVTPVQYWETTFVRPALGTVSASFGLKRIFNHARLDQHRGVDFRGQAGSPVLAWSAGVVAHTADHYLGGLSLFIDHGLGVFSCYLHLSEILVAADEIVVPGQLIGRIGSTGRSTGPHLHFGLSVLGQWVNPLPLLKSPRSVNHDGHFTDNPHLSPGTGGGAKTGIIPNQLGNSRRR